MCLNLLGFRTVSRIEVQGCSPSARALAAILALSPIATARADVLISSAATQDMNCSGGICAPTAADATLNVSDLENLLASGAVKVTTTGSGVQADNIVVRAPFNWTSSSTLSLDAYQSIAFGKTVSITGLGGLAVTTNDGGSGGMLTFGQKGRAAFESLSSQLTINGTAYTLVGTVQSLAGAVAANPAGDYALANDYDAGPDGIYADAPVTTTLTGSMQGLGNTISNLSINRRKVKRSGAFIGLFAEIGSTASIASVKLRNFAIRAHGANGTGNPVGGLVGESEGSLFDDHVSGNLVVTRAGVGGLAGGEDAQSVSQTVTLCSANVHIRTTDLESVAGGLVGGLSNTSIEQSYVTGTITGTYAGGMVGSLYGEVSNSYSSVAISGTGVSVIGGLVSGDANAIIQTSYASGALSGGRTSDVGGLVGKYEGTSVQNNYWDITTSGTEDGVGGGNVSGITGLTTKQLKSGLPPGFDPTIWAEDKKINNGLPYLIANPPEK
jgi:hypothetical protein